MSTIGKNILSDPTSDGNCSTVDDIGPAARPSSPTYSYEEFDRRANRDGNLKEHDSDSLTQTCPTCGGSGKLTKGKVCFLTAALLINLQGS